MTISPRDWARDEPGASPLTPTSTSAVRMARNCVMCLSPFLASVREGPDAEIVAHVPPQAVQTLWLHDEEEDDESAEQHEAEVGDEVEHGLRLEEHAAEGLHRVP